MTLSSEALVARALPLLTACSTITSGTTQKVNFHSSFKAASVAHKDKRATLFLYLLLRLMQAS